MKHHLKKAWLAILAWLVAATGCEEPSRPPAWDECRLASCWDGENAERRMMNVVSPKFTDERAAEYLDWQIERGCDHVHLLLANAENGEGGGYDAIGNADHKAVALKRVKAIRSRGLGVVLWVVSDDSDAIRRSIFANPGAYARSLSDYFPYASYIVLGLEMDEGHGHRRGWTALRDAIREAGWTGPVATHHTSGRHDFADLGEIVMDQLHHDCSRGDIAASVSRLRRRGYAVCGFEYARHADRAKAQAALDAGAFAVGNW